MDELTEAQKQQLKQALETLKRELAQALAANRESTKPVDLDEPIGRISRMDAIQQQHMASANKRQLARRFRLVGRALAIVDSEDYGFCRECEEPIGFPRLRVKPESQLCLGCQEAAEKS